MERVSLGKEGLLDEAKLSRMRYDLYNFFFSVFFILCVFRVFILLDLGK